MKTILTVTLVLLSSASFAISQCYVNALDSNLDSGLELGQARLNAEAECRPAAASCRHNALLEYLSEGVALHEAQRQASNDCFVPSYYGYVYQKALNSFMGKGYSLEDARKLARKHANKVVYNGNVPVNKYSNEYQKALNYFMSQGKSLDEARELARKMANEIVYGTTK